MSCTGLCKIEDHDWERDYRVDIDDTQRDNGSTYVKPGPEEIEFDAGTSEADIWEGENLAEYTVYQTFDHSEIWEEVVEREFPRDGKRLNCKCKGCICYVDWDEPTVLQDWPQDKDDLFIFVRHTERKPKEGDPTKELVTRYVLKGWIRHRKRILQGICKRDPSVIVVPPLREEIEQEEDC